jgi:molybdate transport system substrate-binding protein
MHSLHLISGGAAQGLVTQLKEQFEAQYDCSISSTFGAVGMMKERLKGGAPCDVLILTDALIASMVSSGEVIAGSARALGLVKTGIAVRSGQTAPNVSTPAALKAALQAAEGIYFPDPVKATAGIHVMNVLRRLNLHEELAGRLRPFPNGTTAMKALAEASGHGLLGCTQITEILYVDGIDLVAPLPTEFELATVYTAAVCRASAKSDLAAELVTLLSGPASAGLRKACGFET